MIIYDLCKPDELDEHESYPDQLDQLDIQEYAYVKSILNADLVRLCPGGPALQPGAAELVASY